MELNYRRPILAEYVGEGKDKKLYITGNAIEVGVSRNKVMYSEKELQAAAKTLINKPLLINHGDTDVRNIIGKVVESDFDGKNVPFKALIAPPVDAADEKLIKRLEQRFINSVSIGADCKNMGETDDDGILHPEGIEFLELSLVPIPGVPNASINQVIAENYKVKKMAEEKKEQLEEELKKTKEENEALRKKLTEEEEASEEKPAEQEESEEEKPAEEPEKPAEDETKKEVESLRQDMKKLTEAVSKINEKPKGVAETTESKKDEGFKLITEANKRGIGVDLYSPDCCKEVMDSMGRRTRWLLY